MDIIDRIPEDKIPVAQEIIRIAKEQGIDPRLALAVAIQESGLNQSAIGKKGEIGIMQVMPSTGQGLGFKIDELKTQDGNIRAGLKYLKQGLDKFGWPELAVAGYNAGHDHPFFADPSKNQLPESTQAYVKSIAGFGVLDPVETEPPAPNLPANQSASPSNEDFKNVMADPDRKKELIMQAGSTLAGAAASKGLDVGTDLIKSGAQILQDKRDVLAAQAAQARAGTPPAPIPTDPMHTRQMQGTTDQGTTGRARQTTYNIGTAQQAAGAKEQKSIIDALKQRGIVSDSADSLLSKAQGLTATPSGVLMPASQVYNDIPPTQGTTRPAPLQGPSKMQTIGQMAKAIPSAVFRSPVVTGGLGGLGAFQSASQAVDYAKQGKKPEAGISAAGALSGLASILPFPPPVKAAAAVASVASPLSLYLYEKEKSRRQEAEGLEQMGMSQQTMPSIYQQRYR